MDGIHMTIKYEIMFLEIRGSVQDENIFLSLLLRLPGINIVLEYSLRYIRRHKFLKK